MKQVFTLLLLSTLLGCAGTPEGGDSKSGSQNSRGTDCISEGTIRDYKVLNDSNLVVTGTAKKKYHMELGRGAMGLRSSWQIGFSSPSSWICSGLSELVISDNFGPDRIRIRSIRLLTDDEYEDLLLSFGKGGKRKPPKPEEVKGAEVEELD